MGYQDNRDLAQLRQRIDMMLARGALVATNDTGGIQVHQVALLEGELADDVERFQSYGLSAVPPAGGDTLVAFLAGNRDHGVCVAINDRASRPKNLKLGEVVLYNDQHCTVLLDADGKITVTAEEDISVKGRNVYVEAIEGVVVTAAQEVLIDAGARIDLNAPGGVYANGTRLD